MTCEKIACWLDEHGDGPEKPGWESVLAHTRSCPDCSLFLRQRQELLEAMAAIPQPEYPPGLHGSICQAIEMFSEPALEPSSEHIDQETFLDQLLIGWARPLQIGMSLACLFMVFQLFTLNDERPNVAQSEFQPPSRLVWASQGTGGATPSSQPLPQVSAEEVKAFLSKLEAYRRLHPEMDAPAPRHMDVRLVGHVAVRSR